MLTGMRLGDMAAALDSRQLRRQESRANDEREARRLAALNQGLSQVIGGIGDFQDRKAGEARQAKQDARQATQDEEARKARAAAEGRATAEEGRRAQDFTLSQLDRSAKVLQPGLDARADKAIKDDEGAWIFNEAGDVTIADGRASGKDDMLTVLLDAGFPQSEAEALAAQAMSGADGRQAGAARSAEAAKRAAEDRELKRRDAEAGIGLTEERTKTEAERRRKMRADAAKASRAGNKDPNKDPRKPLPATTLSGISSKEEAIADVRRLRDFYTTKIKGSAGGSGEIVGPLKDFADKFSEMPDWKRFRTLNDVVVQTVGKALEDGKLAEGDAQRYARMLTSQNLDDAEYTALLDEIEFKLSSGLENEVRNLGTTFDTSKLQTGQERPATEAPAKAASVQVEQSAALPDGRIRLTLSNGQTVTTTQQALPSVLRRINGQ